MKKIFLSFFLLVGMHYASAAKLNFNNCAGFTFKVHFRTTFGANYLLESGQEISTRDGSIDQNITSAISSNDVSVDFDPKMLVRNGVIGLIQSKLGAVQFTYKSNNPKITIDKVTVTSDEHDVYEEIIFDEPIAVQNVRQRINFKIKTLRITTGSNSNGVVTGQNDTITTEELELVVTSNSQIEEHTLTGGL